MHDAIGSENVSDGNSGKCYTTEVFESDAISYADCKHKN